MTRKRQNGVRLRVHTYTWKGKRSRVDYVKVCSNRWNNGESTFQANKTSIDGHVNSIEIGPADSCDVTLNVESSGYGSKKKKYAPIKEAEVQEWSRCREELVEVASELEKPCSFVCELCQKATDEPIRCIDCHANFICCAECEQLHHGSSFHKPEIWHVSIRISYTFKRYGCIFFDEVRDFIECSMFQ